MGKRRRPGKSTLGHHCGSPLWVTTVGHVAKAGQGPRIGWCRCLNRGAPKKHCSQGATGCGLPIKIQTHLDMFLDNRFSGLFSVMAPRTVSCLHGQTVSPAGCQNESKKAGMPPLQGYETTVLTNKLPRILQVQRRSGKAQQSPMSGRNTPVLETIEFMFYLRLCDTIK